MDSAASAGSHGQMLRLLGLAFAGADLVFEVDAHGRIAFALGAAERLTGRTEKDLVGLCWTEILSADESELLEALQRGVADGERQGPIRVSLPQAGAQKRKRRAMFSVFRLPHNEQRLSCALSLGPVSAPDQRTDRWGLIESSSFPGAAAALIEEAQAAGLPLQVDLVEFQGLGARMKAMAPADAEAMRRRLAAAFRAEAYQGMGAAELAADRYALLREGDVSSERVTERLRQAAGPNVTPVVAALPLPTEQVGEGIKAMRYALDRFIEEGPVNAAKGFAATVRRTLEDAARFRSRLADGSFELAFQPIVRLTDGKLHHFEALARFDRGVSPAETIRLAEELELIVDFDLAVAASVAKALAEHPDARIAVNVSGLSLTLPRFVDALLRDAARDGKVRRRMLLEVTETKKLGDLDRAKAVIETLTQAGYVFCLDDFGAGAASLDYLRRLPVAYVKIDGRFIQKLQTDSRESVILKHIVSLCRELGISTIAEMIETRPAAELARGLGVELGQGWAFSKALPAPVWAEPEPAATPRRKGEVVQWG